MKDRALKAKQQAAKILKNAAGQLAQRNKRLLSGGEVKWLAV